MTSPAPTGEEPLAPRLVPKIFWSLTALFVVFVLAASFVPASGGLEWAPADARHFLVLPHLSRLFVTHDLRDIASNFVLYMPLGVLIGLALAASRERLRLFSAALLAGPLLSLGVELMQGLTTRTSDAVDLATNSLGHVFGYVITVIAVNHFGLRPAVLVGLESGDHASAEGAAPARANVLAAVRFIYLCVYLVLALLPFNISVSLSKLHAKLVPDAGGQIQLILDPLYHLRHWPEDSLHLLLYFLALAPFGVLSTLIGAYRRRLNGSTPILAAVLAASAGEALKLFNLSRTCDVLIPILGVIAGAVGLAIALLWLRLQHEPELVSGDHRIQRRRLFALASLGYAFVVALLAWYPYQFELHLSAIADKLKHQTNLIPFRVHFAARNLGAAVDLVKEMGVYLPLGLLLAALLHPYRPRLGRVGLALLVGTLCFGYAGFLEATQTACLGRCADVTDVFLGAAGAAVGALLSPLLSGSRSSSR